MKRLFRSALAAFLLAPAALVSAAETPSAPEPVTEVHIIGLRGAAADSLERAGLDAYADGVYGDAEGAFLEAIRGQADGRRDEATLAQLHSNLAWLYYEMKRFGEADSVLRRAVELEKDASGEDSPAVTRRIAELAMFKQAAGRYVDAGGLLDRVIERHAKNPKADPREVAFSLHLLARNYHATGDPKQSETFYQKVLASLDEGETMDARLWATTMLDLAELYHATHRRDEAREAFAKAVKRANDLYAAGGLSNALVLDPYSVLQRRAETVRAMRDSARN